MSSGTAFGKPFIDIDEQRDAPRPHRYLHGGFEGTDTRFSLYLPPAELYQGRMFQFLSGGMGGDESSLAGGFGNVWAFDTVFEDLGGFLVESNQGHFADSGSTGISGDLELFEASAATGMYAKEFAAEAYGQAPHHSYVWGGSGGGLRSLACIENRPDVWDGDVSYVIGDAGGSPKAFAQAAWWLYCRDQREQIIDAVEPGGSGDPFAGLTDDQRAVLATLYRTGWNRGAENQLWISASWIFGMTTLEENDPGYVDDFFGAAGYLGHDDPERLAAVAVDLRCKVTKVHTGPDGPGQMWLPSMLAFGAPAPEIGLDYGVEIDADIDDENRLYMCKATVLSGKAAGRVLWVAMQDGVLLGERMTSPEMFDGIEAGDELRIDNRLLLAFAHRWMYSIDLERWTAEDPITGERDLAPEYAGMSMALVDGLPVYPQREGRDMPVVHHGRLERKVIHVCATHDTIVPVTSVAHYQRMVADHHGDDIDSTYRLWWIENAAHAVPEMLLPATTPEKDPAVWRSRLVDYDGALREALTAIVAWVEDGVAPATSTSYRFTADSGLVLATSAAERGGVQPVARAAANGGTRAEVKVGETVTLTGTAEQPPGTGTFVRAAWDFEGRGEFIEQDLDPDATSIKVDATFAYAEPGTYFPSFRAAAHRDGATGTGLPVENNARVRVVVSA
jgi:hypothetical protein